MTENSSNWKIKAAIAVAGIGGTALIAKVFRDIWEQYFEDDCYITARLFNAIYLNMIFDYQLNKKERQELVDALNKDGSGLRSVQVSLLNSPQQEADIRAFLQPKIEAILSSREYISSIQVAFSAT